MKTVSKVMLTAVLVVIVFVAVVPSNAHAAQSTSKYSYTPAHKGYTLSTIVQSNQNPVPIGFRYVGYYFGDSGITVSFDVFSSDNFPIDFFVNDSIGAYSAQQLDNLNIVKALAEDIHNLINQVDDLANTQYNGSGNLPTSDIYRYNAAVYGQKLQIDYHTYKMLQIAKEMYQATNGAYNPAVYRLVDLWGFSSRIYSNGDFGLPYDRAVSSQEFWNSGYPLPEQKYIDAFSASAFLDFSDNAVILSQEGDNYYVTKNVQPATVDGEVYQQWLDLGGVAKGYVVDLIRQKFNENNVTSYSVDAGSSSMVFGTGHNGSDEYLVIPDPFLPTAAVIGTELLSLNVTDKSVSTSGQYVRKYTTNGVEYAHIIDGAAGAPAQTGINLVTIVAPQGSFWASQSDCLTTALTVMGRDGCVNFMNGYLKEQNIQVVITYQDVSGNKQILSNVAQSDLVSTGKTFNDFAWAVKQQDGVFVYDEQAVSGNSQNNYTWLIITLASIAGAVVIATVVYYFLRGRRSALKKVQSARRDKPFKVADVAVYLLVVLLIGILFSVFFAKEEDGWSIVNITDVTNEEVLFVYNAKRNEYQINDQNSNGWQISVEQQTDGLLITLSREIDGKEHFNVVKVTRGNKPSVKMQDSLCGYHQDCIRTFGEVKVSGGAIVCSPNRIKVITE